MYACVETAAGCCSVESIEEIDLQDGFDGTIVIILLDTELDSVGNFLSILMFIFGSLCFTGWFC